MIPTRSGWRKHNALPFPLIESARNREACGGLAFTGVEDVQRGVGFLAGLRRRGGNAEKQVVNAVAFEDPNTQNPRISIAMSRTWGHIFTRDRPEASVGAASVEKPLVAVKFPEIAVGWHGPDKQIKARTGRLQ